MGVDVTDLRAFYASPLGSVAHRVVERAATGFWPDLRGLSLLGLGYATPYLAGLGVGCQRVLAFMPAHQGVVRWPETGPSGSALVDPTILPLPPASIDRVLVVHALETGENPAELLSELWRVLTPGGKLILVAPNRRGLWARLDTTPFGEGRPFSRPQLRDLMRQAMFMPCGWVDALYVPPLKSRILLRGAGAWERLGTGLSLPFHGLHIVEATKLFHRPVPVRATRRAERLAPVLVPMPAGRSGLS